MKTKFLGLLFCFLCACSSDKNDIVKVPVTAISLNETTINLQVGDTRTLVATIAPDNATNKTVSWTSSDATIVNVNSSGKIDAIKAGGPITITAKAEEQTATCTIFVISKS